MSQPKKLNALISLRFFACIIVVGMHTNNQFFLLQNLPIINMSPVAYQVVSFFFIMSGFILVYIYPSLQNWNDVRRFFIARVARIWPLHLFSLLCFYLIFTNCFEVTGLSITLANIFLVHSWLPIRSCITSFNAPSWSLSTDCFFYLCFPILLISLKKSYSITIAITALLMILMIYISNHSNLIIDDIVYTNPLTRLFEFVLGMTTALLFINKNQLFKINMTQGTILELLAIFIIIMVAIRIHFLNSDKDKMIHLIGKSGVVYIFESGLAIFTCFLVFVLALEKGIISQILSHKIPVFLGEISFAIYLTHYNLLHFYIFRLKSYYSFNNLWTLIICYWIVLLISSIIIYYVLEMPCRRFIHNVCDWLKFKMISNANANA